jgi:hypothetical protein
VSSSNSRNDQKETSMTDAQISPIQKVWSRSQEDPDFRSRLIAEPRGTLLEEMGLAIPEGIEIEVVESTPTKMVIALPTASDEVDADELDDVVGFTWCYHVNWLKDPNTTTDQPNRWLQDPNLPDVKRPPLGGLG